MSDKKSANNEDITFFRHDLLEIPIDGKRPYLKGYRCRHCGQLDFPKLSPCPNCWHDEFDAVPLSRRGRLYSFSEIFVGQAGMQTPYTFGYIDLPENLRIFAQVEGDPGALKCDDEVELVIGTIRMNHEGRPLQSYKFRKRCDKRCDGAPPKEPLFKEWNSVE